VRHFNPRPVQDRLAAAFSRGSDRPVGVQARANIASEHTPLMQDDEQMIKQNPRFPRGHKRLGVAVNRGDHDFNRLLAEFLAARPGPRRAAIFVYGGGGARIGSARQ